MGVARNRSAGEGFADRALHIPGCARRYYVRSRQSGCEINAKRGIRVAEHPIESLMSTSMESIREMVDVNTVVGDPVATQDGSTIIPISRVSFGFVAGGGEYAGGLPQPQPESLPFAGGAGAGVSVSPVGFLVCSANGVRLLSASCASPMERLVELLPQALDGLRAMEQEEEGRERPPQVSAAYREG